MNKEKINTITYQNNTYNFLVTHYKKLDKNGNSRLSCKLFINSQPEMLYRTNNKAENVCEEVMRKYLKNTIKKLEEAYRNKHNITRITPEQKKDMQQEIFFNAMIIEISDIIEIIKKHPDIR